MSHSRSSPPPATVRPSYPGGAAGTPTRDRLLDLVARMEGQPVLMLIDPVADRFVTGTPKRISREAPVLILRYEGERLAPGGGANAVANVAALGGRPLPLGLVGDDDSGRGLVAELASRGVDTSGLRLRRGYRTPTKVRIVGGARHALKQQIVRYDVEESLVLDDADREAHRQRVEAWRRELPSPPRVAIVSDYGYGGVEPGLLPLLRHGLADGGAVVCDSRYRLAQFGGPDGCDGATPNEEEAEALHGGPLEDGPPQEGSGAPAGTGPGTGTDAPETGPGGAPGSLERTGEALRSALAVRFLLVTRGSRGMSLFEDGTASHLPVHGTDQVADVTGAGDTVIGTFALALAAGASLLEAALLADYAGGVVVMKMGTATLTADELAAAVESDPLPLRDLRQERSRG